MAGNTLICKHGKCMLLFFLQEHNAQELICVSIRLVGITGQFPSQSRNQTTDQSVDTQPQQS